MKKFIVNCLAVPAAALFLLFFVNKAYLKVMDTPYTDTEKFSYMGDVYTAIQIANVGSSHAEYAFYYEDLYKVDGYQCFNFAMSSQTYDYDYALLSEYKQYLAPGGIMFIPVSCFSFNNEVTNEKEAEALSIKYYTFLSPRNIPHYDPYVDFVTVRFPVLSAGEDIFKLFPQLSITADAAEIPDDVRFQEMANQRFERHMAGKEDYFLPERVQELYDIIELCREADVTPVLITTPYTKYYYELFDDDFLSRFYDTVNQVAADTGTPYYDYSYDERFRGNLAYFSDADHLNTEGAKFFMEIIEQEIPEFQELLSR